MEVLSRLLAEASMDVEQFRFHPKCSKLKLTHLCFADDLLIFSAAELNSIQTINRVLVEFEELSGLKANPSKSSFLCSGVHKNDKAAFLDVLQMPEGSLPVQYLGVPLITKRLSAFDCEVLVANISGRIDSWLVRNLSFAGRLQLISSVLFSLQVFWARISILPKKVIRILEQKFNRFLWCGKDSKAKAKVAWKKLWEELVEYLHPQSLFLELQKLLNLKETAKKFISFKVGEGTSLSLWFDLWHPAGRLLDTYVFRIVYDIGSSLDARLSSVIKDRKWSWPPARSDTFVEIQNGLFDVDIGDRDILFLQKNMEKFDVSLFDSESLCGMG
ncbi:uncharacterized protein LOC133851454 [Alnus glutinosa]|uniref:uncharacterized protein LOC133851454 n=1 Tax=Alnus glutinosa TaxID=3517 RepID=UPI002D79EF0D|nr:uncharacterized protein LOC133851454 [Alnus glutinosa]